MTSRWGSCNVSTARITLSTHLVHHDPRCLTYVIIHELCHLYEPSHNERFHALMDGFCPDWRESSHVARASEEQPGFARSLSRTVARPKRGTDGPHRSSIGPHGLADLGQGLLGDLVGTAVAVVRARP